MIRISLSHQEVGAGLPAAKRPVPLIDFVPLLKADPESPVFPLAEHYLGILGRMMEAHRQLIDDKSYKPQQKWQLGGNSAVNFFRRSDKTLFAQGSLLTVALVVCDYEDYNAKKGPSKLGLHLRGLANRLCRRAPALVTLEGDLPEPRDESYFRSRTAPPPGKILTLAH